MGDVSDNFSRHEFACKCGCGFDAVDIELIQINEAMRSHFGNRVVNIHSGCRCPYWNGRKRGRPRSQHINGIAEDFDIEGVPTDDVGAYLEMMYPDTYGIGIYTTWAHLDLRKERGRW